MQCLAKELFRAVQAAEENADLILQEAQREAREQIKTAEAEITAHERAISLEHRALYQSMMEEKRVAVEAHIKAQAPALQKAQEESLAAAHGRLDTAARRVFERVWNDGNR